MVWTRCGDGRRVSHDTNGETAIDGLLLFDVIHNQPAAVISSGTHREGLRDN